jgi:tetratricopeptide (TPR) repeat protein
MAAATMGLGNALAMMGRYEDALERYEQTLARRPRLPEAEFAAGFATGAHGKAERS